MSNLDGTNSDKRRGKLKFPKIVSLEDYSHPLKKPSWLRAKIPQIKNILETKKLLKDQQISTVCWEASCPNIGECYGRRTAAFLIMGQRCTRRCPFCDVAFGRPLPLDPDEPKNLSKAIELLQLKYIVITSVNRDDLRDGGAKHFLSCIDTLRREHHNVKIEVLVPDFRGCQDIALETLSSNPPDVFNHNIETVPRLYKKIKPGSSYENSLNLLKQWSLRHPHIPTKTGIMVGLGETDQEVYEVMQDLRRINVQILTIGQYIAPSKEHIPVQRYVSPELFKKYQQKATEMGFLSCFSGPFVRSSYLADKQALLLDL